MQPEEGGDLILLYLGIHSLKKLCALIWASTSFQIFHWGKNEKEQ